MSRAGYVLVGGKSSRMGRDKALLPFRGTPLVRSVARSVELAAGSAVLVGDPQRYGALGYPVVPDLYPGEGPLGGILSALNHTAATVNLVTACDLPELSAGFLETLLDAAEATTADALVPVGPSGRPEPLCAVYHRRSLDTLERAFAAGTRAIAAALQDLRIIAFPVTEPAYFQNVNTPQDWADYAAE